MKKNLMKILYVFFFSITTQAVHSAVILDGIAQGQFTDSGNNFLGSDTTVVGFDDNRHGFITFDLAAISDSTSSAILHVNVGRYLSVIGDFNLDFFDYVSGNDTQLKNTQSGNLAMWTDLGNGNKYGSVTINENNEPDNTTLNILLNSFAISDINNSMGGLFTIGLSSDNNPNIERMLWSTTGDLQASLELTSNQVPEPTSLTLLGLGLASFGFSRKKKKA